jgi:hypothetical protein
MILSPRQPRYKIVTRRIGHESEVLSLLQKIGENGSLWLRRLTGQRYATIARSFEYPYYQITFPIRAADC